MGRPPVENGKARTTERLLEAAEEEFGASGFAAARLADIARRAGIRRPSLLYHYSTKEELYRATIERAFASLAASFAQSMSAPADFERRLQRVTEDFARFLEGRPAIARLILREFLTGQGPGRDILISQVAPLLDQVERFITAQGGDRLNPASPIRAAIMQNVANLLLQNSSRELKELLWGPGDEAWTLVRLSFFKTENEVSS